MKKFQKIIALLVIAAFLFAGVLYLKERLSGQPSDNIDVPATEQTEPAPDSENATEPSGGEEQAGGAAALAPGGSYTSKEDVALYLHLYGALPGNYLTKDEARARGWDSAAGNLQEVAPGMSIGGDRFGNYEGALPDAQGRVWFECDIDYDGGHRNAKRIVYSSDGLVYYTEDHYETFELLYESGA